MLAILVAVVALIILSIAIFKYPMLSLALFIMAGQLKAYLRFKFGFFRVVDVTVLFAILVLIAMTYSFVKSGGRWRDIISLPLCVYLLLAGILLLGVAYTSAPHYGLEKSSRFATLGLIAFLAPVFFAHSMKDIRMMIWILVVIGIIFTVGTIIAPHAAVLREGGTRGGFMETDPLATAVQIGTAAIIVFVFTIMAWTSLGLRILSLVMIPAMVIAMVITGSRGPFLGLVFTWLVAVLICRRGISKGWAPLVIAAIFVVMVVSFGRLPQEITMRIANMWRSSYDARKSASSRTRLFELTIEESSEHLIFGHGTGAWAVDRGGQDVREYPHNIILELLYEQGLAGVIVLSLFLWLIFRRWRKASKFVHLYKLDIETSQFVHISILLFLFAFIQSMKSGDIDSNRFMFFCAGLVVAVFSQVHRMVEEVSLESELIAQEGQYSEEFEFQDAQILY